MERGEIRELLSRLERARKELLRPYFLELGLTLGQGQPRILCSLYRKGPVTQRELADACDLDVTTMSRTLDRLSEAGLLERQKNPECRRSFLICLTESGHEKAKRVTEAFALADERIENGFDQARLQHLAEDLQQILKNLE